MRILVVGLLPYDSGKTEFTLTLAKSLEGLGFRPGYFKPVAGHDGWYQYDTLTYSMEQGLLIGHDAYLAAEKLDLFNMLHVISPIDIMTFPVDPFKPGMTIRSYVEHMSSVGKRVVIMRYTRVFNKSSYENLYFTCRDSIGKLSRELLNVYEELLSKLRRERSSFIETSTEHIEKILATPEIYDSVDPYIEYLAGRDPILIEGYNDVASPTNGSLNVDYVFLVGPGKALLYSGDRYRMAVKLLSYRGYPWMIKTTSVFEVLGKPLKIYDVPLKTYGERYRGLFDEIAEFIMGER